MRIFRFSAVTSLLALSAFTGTSRAADYPAPTQGDFTISNFHFRSGESLPELKIHYRILGTPHTNDKGVTDNAVLIMHGTTGTGDQFFRKEFCETLFNKGQLLDASKYFLIFPDDIGHGQSSKPSDGLHAKFPHYDYADMVDAEYQLVTTGLKANHLRLVMGTSMGGMHTWLWGEMYPTSMDLLMPLASLPVQISGRNRMWRQMISDATRLDPTWKDGDYTTPPVSLHTVAGIMFFMSSNPALRYKEAPTGDKAAKQLEDYAATFVKKYDANDVLYAVESSRDYDPNPDLAKIQAPLLAINSADDLINPPDQNILETEIKKVKNGKAIVVPEGPLTTGHGTHTTAAVWKDYLEEFLKN